MDAVGTEVENFKLLLNASNRQKELYKNLPTNASRDLDKVCLIHFLNTA